MSANTTANPIDIIHRAQQAIAKFLPPNSGIHPTACISELLGILDSREAVAMTAQTRGDTPPEETAKNLAACAAGGPKMTLLEFLFKRVHSVEQQEATIAHLRDELQRRREHETHLIQSRDGLIQKLVTAEKKLEAVRLALT